MLSPKSLAADAGGEERTLIEDRHAGVIPEHEANDVEDGGGFENDSVFPCWNFSRLRRVDCFLAGDFGQVEGSRFVTSGEFAFCHPEESASQHGDGDFGQSLRMPVTEAA